jgi:superfamily II DNA helicase RecQ
MCWREKWNQLDKVQMYHSMTPQEVKDKIGFHMSTANGNIKVQFCTNAAGMGITYKGVDFVVLVHHTIWIPLYSIAGSPGRDGSQSTHLLLFNGQQLRNVSTDMLVYTKNTSQCRREALLSGYDAKPDSGQILHLCCDLCTGECKCEKEHFQGLAHPALEDASEEEDEDD